MNTLDVQKPLANWIVSLASASSVRPAAHSCSPAQTSPAQTSNRTRNTPTSSWNATKLVLLLATIPRSRRKPSHYSRHGVARAESFLDAAAAADLAVEAAAEPSRRAASFSLGASLFSLGSSSSVAADAGGQRLALLNPSTLSRAKGKVCIVTGATAGIGLEAARNLVSSGARVYVCGRTIEKARLAVKEITEGAKTRGSGGQAVPLELDLSSLGSVRRFVDTWKSEARGPIEILALNAGLSLNPALQVQHAPLSKDGFELTLATNYLGHFLLFRLLEDELSTRARIVVTTSAVHDPALGAPGAQATLGSLIGLREPGNSDLMVDGGPYAAEKAYRDSKLCGVLFTLELTRRLRKKGSAITVNCFGPGVIPSKTWLRYQDPAVAAKFAMEASSVLGIAETTEFGGDCLTFMALSSTLDGRSGLFYSAPGGHRFLEETPSREARDVSVASELWKRSSTAVGVAE